MFQAPLAQTLNIKKIFCSLSFKLFDAQYSNIPLQSFYNKTTNKLLITFIVNKKDNTIKKITRKIYNDTTFKLY